MAGQSVGEGGWKVVAPGEGVQLGAGALEVTLKVTSQDSDRFTLVDFVAPPGFAAPPVLHHHTREDWAAYVLEGELTFLLPDREVRAVAGTTVFVPAGCDFAWRNDREEPGRFLAFHAPAGFDGFFAEIANSWAARGEGPISEVMREVIPPLWERYGIEPRTSQGQR